MSYSYRSNRNTSTKRRPSSFGQNNRRKSTKKFGGEYIDPSRFIKTAEPVTAEAYTPIHSFDDFDIQPILKNNLKLKGYKSPSEIQDLTIPHGLAGKDVIGMANTGTGKTAAFAIPVLEKLITQPDARALIVAPTRELAQQIEAECKILAKGSGLYGAILIGGSSMGPQLKDLRSNPKIVIGTPGRIKDHLSRNTLSLKAFDTVVLDEVDRMLDMGFVNDVKQILGELKAERQSFFFSATMDTRVRSLIDTFSSDPHVVSLQVGSTSSNVHQDVMRYESQSDKIDILHEILLREELGKVIVFDETQRGVERLNNELVKRGFKAHAIHGGKSQGQRQQALAKFKASEVRILVATDVAARGIDVADITHVINYSIPKAYDDYIHRIGRAGRAGNVGYALTFVSKN